MLVNPKLHPPATDGQRASRTLLLALAFLAATSVSFGQNINWGLLRGTLGFETGFEYTDNLDNDTNYVNNFYYVAGPTFNGGLNLPIHFAGASGEEMSIYTGASYSEKYSLSGNGNEQSFSAPVTVNVTFPFTLGKWMCLLSDGFAFQNDNLETAVAINEPSVEIYNNTAALSMVRNFGKASITLAGTRSDEWCPSELSLENHVYQFSFTPGFLVRDNYTVFWQNTYGLVYQNDPTLQDSEGYSSSVGVSGQITPSLNGTISVGYAHSHLKTQTLGPGTGIFGGIFDPETVPADNHDGVTSVISISYAHPLSPNTTYSFSAFNNPGVTAILKDSSLTETYGTVLGIAHRLTPRVTLNPVFTWTHAETIGQSSSGEKTDLFGAGMNYSRTITSRLNSSLEYSYFYRSSNLPGDTYYVNRISYRLTYTF